MAVAINKVHHHIRIARAIGANLLLMGAHGRAKTAIVQLCGKEDGYRVICKNLSQLEPSDMIGLPITGKHNGQDVTISAYPKWLVEACDPTQKTILFFDEFTNAEDDVFSSIMTLLQEREVDDMKLADNTQIILAANPPSIAPNAHIIGKALRDRLCVIPISDEPDAYLEHYKEKGMRALVSLFDSMGSRELVPSYELENEQTANENAEPTYRSLENSYLAIKACMEEEDEIYRDVANDMVCGFVGNGGDTICKELWNNIESGETLTILEEAIDNGDVDEIVRVIKEDKIFQQEIEYQIVIKKVHNIETAIGSDVFEEKIRPCLKREFMAGYRSVYPKVEG